MKVTTFEELCLFLNIVRAKKIYLIHEPYREREARQFATTLKSKGLVPFVAADFRVNGKDAIKQAISMADFCLVLAFDNETVEICKKRGVAVFDMRPSQGKFA